MKKSKLVRNEAKPKVKPEEVVQRFTVNLLPSQCRVENLEGRPHTVVPMVMITQGVFNGSNGPLFYTEEELSKTPQAWDHKPIVVYHPQDTTGDGISACQPSVINNQKVGIMLNTKWVGKGLKLVSEAWIENSKADTVDPRILQAVQSKEVMEVSTGLFVDKELNEGEYNGREYTGIARNLRPDHLALLPDQIGACSVQDGAGLLRNAAKKDSSGKLAQKVTNLIKELGLIDNELSFDNTRSALNAALREKFQTKKDGQPWLWVMDVYSNFVIYEMDGGKLFRLGYTNSDTGVSLSDDKPIEVTRVTEYRTVAGAKFVGNRDQSKKVITMSPEQKKKTIDTLIANQDSGWSEDQRPVLEAMKDNQLEAQAKAFKKEEAKPEPAPATNKEKEAPAAKEKEAPAPAAPAPVFNYEQWKSSAPREVQDMVDNGVAMLNEEHKKLVGEITANENNTFSEAYLKARPLQELRGIAALARKSAPAAQAPLYSYEGQAPTVTSNAGASITPLALPSMDFTPAGSK